MRIAIVNSEYEGPGGIDSYTKSITKALANNGHQVYLLHKKKEPYCINHENIIENTIHRTTAKNRLLRYLGYRVFWKSNLHLEYAAGTAETVNALFTEKKIDIAEIPDFNGEALFMDAGKTPYISRLHTPWKMVRKWNNIKSNRLSDYVIDFMEKKSLQKSLAVSSPSQALINSFPAGWIPAKTPRTVIPYPITKADVKEDRKIFNQVILFASRLELRKGIDWFCCVIPEILEKYPETGAIIAGQETAEAKPHMERMITILKERSQLNRCQILGAVSHEKALSLVNQADIIAVPSRFDNFPNIVLESMAAEKCVVAAASGGIPEMIEDLSSGLLFNVAEGSRGLLEKLETAIRNNEMRKELAHNAREKIKRAYAPDKVADQTVDFYKEVLSGWKS